MSWFPIGKVMHRLRQLNNSSWCRQMNCKYIQLWIDTRDMHCQIKDRYGRDLTLADIEDWIKKDKKTNH